MNPHLLDLWTLVVYAIWGVSAAALIVNVVMAARRKRRV
jgi:hypothetical protein